MAVTSTTLELTTAIASGDPEAFARFYEAWFDRVVAEAQRLTRRDESFCLDVAQDVFLRVIRKMKPISAEPALTRWMHLVVRSVAYDRLRREARTRLRESARGTGPPADEPAIEALAERLHWLEAELRRVDPGALDLLMMRHRFGWTLEKIGARLGLGAGAVDGRLRRVVEQLRQRAALAETTDEP